MRMVTPATKEPAPELWLDADDERHLGLANFSSLLLAGVNNSAHHVAYKACMEEPVSLRRCIFGMPDNSQLYVEVSCADPTVAIIDKLGAGLRCSYTTRATDTPCVADFHQVMQDFKQVCDALEGVMEVEVTALDGWGILIFEQSRLALHKLFINPDNETSTRHPLKVYRIIGRYPGIRRLGADGQRYARLEAFKYAVLADYHAA
jgi:hypothetical protein